MSISMTSELQHCIDACRRCADMCIEATIHCLGRWADEEHVRPLMDCADVCTTSGNFLRRMSRMSWRLCDVCGEICEQCADLCDRYPKDEIMARCARACRDCSNACQEMAKLVTKAA
jgi:formylglycine-generating enzyme required for sulfatase activity